MQIAICQKASIRITHNFKNLLKILLNDAETDTHIEIRPITTVFLFLNAGNKERSHYICKACAICNSVS